MHNASHDPLSQFLHSTEWQNHFNNQKQPFVSEAGNLWNRVSLPFGGQFWRTARIPITENFVPPAETLNGWFLRIQPDSQDSYHNLKNWAKAHHFQVKPTPSLHPRETLTINCQKTDAELLADMHPKHRYNIKTAQKHGVSVEWVQGLDVIDAAAERFIKLHHRTNERHNLRDFPDSYYRSLIHSFAATNNVALVFATHEGVDCSGAIIILNKPVATYLFGGSDYSKRKVMAPYLMHSEVIHRLRNLGYSTYDLWGITTREGEAIDNHPSYGTTRFKLGFGGERVSYPATLDIVQNRICYNLYAGAQFIRRRGRRNFSDV